MSLPWISALRMLAMMTLLCGAAYPLVVTTVAHALFPDRARGSLVHAGGRPVGSRLLAQPFSGAGYFHPRPSAARYATLPSGAGNQGGTSAALRREIGERAAFWRAAAGGTEPVPEDLLLASGSGLDPHISPEAAAFQVDRVAHARGFDAARRAGLASLVRRHIEEPQGGLFGCRRVNVLLLNLDLDAYAVGRDER